MLVHCRTGSLETIPLRKQRQPRVHCRTGSLESLVVTVRRPPGVHCRTGSLEKQAAQHEQQETVHCRTGSLENCVAVTDIPAYVHCRTGCLGRINSLIIRINCAIHFWTTKGKSGTAENSDSRGPTAGRSAIFALSARHSALTATTPQQISPAIADARATQER